MNLLNCISLAYSSPSSFINVILEEQIIDNSLLLNSKNLFLNTKALQIKSNLPERNCSYRLLLATDSVYRFTAIRKKKLNLFQELTNKYWQQTIFLSHSTPLSKKYITNLIKTDNLLVKNEYKKNLINFTKALLMNRIDSQVLLDSANNTSPYIQYIWRKGCNIEFSRSWHKAWLENQFSRFFDKKQKALLNTLKYNQFPVFIVVNGFKQIVIAAPGEELIAQTGLVNSISKWYSDHFLLKSDNNKMYEGWFFMNPYDAFEYKDYIQSKYPRASKDNGLAVVAAGIDTYYRLHKQTTSKAHFRLLPDLSEIGKIVKSRSYQKGLIFHPKQKYGESYFQGQPIYIIQPANILGNGNNHRQNISYSYNLPDDPLGEKYNPIFLNKEVALIAWANFRNQLPSVNLPENPVLMVYNLEDFLNDYKNNLNNLTNNKKFLLVPSRETYNVINHNREKFVKRDYLEHLYNNCYPYLFMCKTWLRRAIWSLSSRQPPH